MYISNIANTIKQMTDNKLIDFTFKNYYKRIGFVKERRYYPINRLNRKDLSLLATKLIEKCLVFAMLKNTIKHL